MNKITLKSIGELVRVKDTPARSSHVEHYLIPDYQRGYRWKADEHVKALLEDVDQFMSKKESTHEIYCLQPIVVVPQVAEDGFRAWEVVDGQQRLTTLYLVLRALNYSHYELSYCQRKESTRFLADPVKSYNEKDPFPDHYFIHEAYAKISHWLEQKELEMVGYKLQFLNALLQNVKVIWYEVELKGNTGKACEKEKIDIFNRLNIGKIPLDDAELIRALFLQSMSLQLTNREQLLSQATFALEWQEMEQYLRNPAVWGFIHLAESKETNYSNRILKLFEIVAQQTSGEARATYLWFERELGRDSQKRFEASNSLWKDVKNLFAKIRAWYENPELYHGIGLLISLQHINLKGIYRQSKNQTKHEFASWIWDKVQEKINTNIDKENFNYEERPTDVERVLLLFNVLSTREKSKATGDKFPFHRYQGVKKWSLEHIHAQHTDDPFKDKNNIKAWINETLPELEGIRKQEDLSKLDTQMQQLEKWASVGTEKIDIDKFNSVRFAIEDFFVENPVHSIDNLALLSAKDNSALNKAIFPVKRRRILELERQGSFIPPCTKDVFLKTYSPTFTATYRWTKDDREAYVKEIKRILATLNQQNNDSNK